MMKEPKKIKMSDNDSSKEVKKIPMPPLKHDQYDIHMSDDVYIMPDNDSIYTPINNYENHLQDDQKSV